MRNESIFTLSLISILVFSAWILLLFIENDERAIDMELGTSLTHIQSSDIIANSRTTINNNFADLNRTKLENGTTTSSLLIGSLTVGTISATSTSATSTFAYPVSIFGESLFIGGTATTSIFGNSATSTFASGLVISNGSLALTRLPSCSGTSVLETNSTGVITCGTDLGASEPNLTYSTLSGTRYYTASSTATDNLAWHFNNGFVSSGASSTASLLFNFNNATGSQLTLNDLLLGTGFIDRGASSTIRNLHAQSINATSTGNYFGGLTIDSTGFLRLIPSTTCNPSTAGDICIDSSAEGQLVFNDGTSDKVLRPNGRLKSHPIATSSLTHASGGYSTTGTTTWTVAGYDEPITFQSVRCLTDPLGTSNGTTTIRIGDGTNWSEFAQCDDRPNGIKTTLSTNVTFTAGENIQIQFGTRISNSDYISFDAPWLYTQQ